MKAYMIEAEITSPVMLADKRSTGHLIEGLGHIPGTALRGVVAECFDPLEFNPGNAACEIFVEGKVSFGPLYPGGAWNPARPIPLSALTCKYHKGFATEDRGKGHGVLDALMPDSPPDVCPRRGCGAPLEPMSGYYYANGRGEYSEHSAFFRRIAHTAISSCRAVADPGKLYTYEALDTQASPGDRVAQVFSGALNVADEDAHLIAAIKEKLIEKGNRVFLGKARTRGYGAVVLRVLSEQPQKTRGQIKSAFGKLNDRLTLTLTSDCIVLDPLLRYKSWIEPDDLAEATGVEAFKKLSLTRFYAGTTRVRGWNRAVGLPREDEIAISAGSSFLYTLGETSIDDILDGLVTLTCQGLGERRAEGFGRVIICDAFHREDVK